MYIYKESKNSNALWVLWGIFCSETFLQTDNVHLQKITAISQNEASLNNNKKKKHYNHYQTLQYLHWISVVINHVLWTWMMFCITPVKVKLDCRIYSFESTPTHFNVVHQVTFHCGKDGEISTRTNVLKYRYIFNSRCATVSVPVCPVFLMELMTYGEEKLVKVKLWRLGSLQTSLVTMLIGDWLSPPQEESGRDDQWEGVWSVNFKRVFNALRSICPFKS